MAGVLYASLNSILASATSIRICSGTAPASYASALAQTIGLATFTAGSAFTFTDPNTITAAINGSITAVGTPAWLCVCIEASTLLAVTGSPTFSNPFSTTSGSVGISISLARSIGAPLLTQN